MSEELQEVIDNNPEWYRELQYKDVKIFIRDNINNATRSFVAIGFYLKHIRDKEMFREDGYESVWELAQAEFGISKSQASKFMSINDRFSKDGNSPILLDQYKDFSSSKLSEMLYLTDEQLEQVTVGTTVAQIREIKNPDKVVSTSKQEPVTKVCKWDGKSSCVAVCDTGAECCVECKDHGHCNGECGWQDERIPKPKSPKEFKPCKFGGGQCNLFTDPSDCSTKVRCASNFTADTAEQQPEIKSEYSIEVMVRYSVPNLDVHEELKKLCAYNIPGNDNEVMKLMIEQGESSNFAGKWSFSENGFTYTTSDTQQTKTISWEEYCDAFRRDNKHSIACQFDLWKGKPAVKKCENCNYNDMDPDKYRTDHPEATEFPCNSCDDKLNHWEPKVGSPEPERVRDTALSCKFDSSVRCLIAHKNKCGNDSINNCMYYAPGGWTEDDYIDAEPEKVETVTADIIQTVPEDKIPLKQIPDKWYYLVPIGANDISGTPIREGDILEWTDFGGNTKEYQVYYDQRNFSFEACEVERVGTDTLKCIQNHMLCKATIIRNVHEGEELIPEVIEESEPVKPVQPELPILKNNDQRKEWAENYKAWGEWYYDEYIDCHYYKYDFANGDRVIVEEYHDRERYWADDKKDEQFYHLLLKKKQAYGGKRTYEEKFSHQTSSMSEIVEHLKNLQKKGA